MNLNLIMTLRAFISFNLLNSCNSRFKRDTAMILCKPRKLSLVFFEILGALLLYQKSLDTYSYIL